MEMNPFTLDSEGKPFPLDMRGELDDTAAFKSGKKCVPSRPRRAHRSVCRDTCLPRVMPLSLFACCQICKQAHWQQAQVPAVKSRPGCRWGDLEFPLALWQGA